MDQDAEPQEEGPDCPFSPYGRKLNNTPVSPISDPVVTGKRPAHSSPDASPNDSVFTAGSYGSVLERSFVSV